MGSNVITNFVRQQGCAVSDNPGARFRSLNFQPSVVAPLAAAALITQWVPLFLALGVLLWWSALLPRWNPFDAVFNAFIARDPDRPRLDPSPPPRRFAMGMAGTFFLTAGLSVALGWTLVAAVLQVMIVVALTALLLGKFCMGSYVFHLLRGEVRFANRTLPWGRP